jgi:uncharacterized protein YbjT (DUF2867 family)
MNVLVYGATGSQAGPTVHALLERGHQPLVFTRSAAKAAALAEAGATIVEGDMAHYERLVEASRGMDAVALLVPFFVANPADALAYGRNAIEAAREADVGLIVWNTSGPMPPARTGNLGMDLRIEIAELLKASEIPHIVFEPSAYAENLLGPWTAPAVANQNQVTYPVPEDMRIGWLASADVGKLVTAAIERPELAGSYFKISGIEAPNGAELAAAFSEALGRPIGYHALPPREFGAILDGVFGPGAGDEAAALYQSMWDSPQRPPMHVDMTPVLAQLPVQMHTMREWVAAHAAAFTPVEG